MIITERSIQLVKCLKPGSCYQGAFLLMRDSPIRSHDCIRLCHGVAVLTKEPFDEFGHGWLEVQMPGGGCLVYDPKFPGQTINREEYYRVGQVRTDKVFRYSWFEARRLSREANHYGPWNPVVEAASHAGDASLKTEV